MSFREFLRVGRKLDCSPHRISNPREQQETVARFNASEGANSKQRRMVAEQTRWKRRKTISFRASESAAD